MDKVRFEMNMRGTESLTGGFCCIHPSALLPGRGQESGLPGEFSLKICSRGVKSQEDLNQWAVSASHSEFLRFIKLLAQRVVGVCSIDTIENLPFDSTVEELFKACNLTVPLPSLNALLKTENSCSNAHKSFGSAGGVDCLKSMVSLKSLGPPSIPLQTLGRIMWILLKFVDDIKPVSTPVRFGNPSFRVWCQRLYENADELLQPTFKAAESAGIQLSQSTKDELKERLCFSFGSASRLDFGTGHEAAFGLFLYCLFRSGILAGPVDEAYAVMALFKGYIQVTHKLQQTYMLEAAGSRGVWGLDDFHFLSFLWGAAQLSNDENFSPAQITDATLMRLTSGRLLYSDSIRYIIDTKRGAPFSECAPVLYDISGVPTWQRVYLGLVSMYDAEVLKKLPIIQHFLFGPLFPFDQ